MATTGNEVLKDQGSIVWSPSYEIDFTYNGNDYQLTVLMVTRHTDDSSDLDTTMQAMVGALGEDYTDVSLTQYLTTTTALTV